MNPRKDKIKYTLWLTPEESKSIEILKTLEWDENMEITAKDILQESIKRGDLNK